jgi:hypothetical protein
MQDVVSSHYCKLCEIYDESKFTMPTIRSEPRQVKVNDDGSFHANTSAGFAERFFEIRMVIFLPHQRFF